MNYGDTPPETEDDTAVGHSWHDAQADEPLTGREAYARPAFLHGFGQPAEPPADEEDEDSTSGEAAQEAPGAEWATRINRPWREIVEASRISAEEDEEDAEVAIREALKAALEHPGEDGTSTGRFQEKLRSQHEEHPRSDAGWNSFAPRGTQPRLAIGEEEQEDETTAAEAEGADHPPFTIPGHAPVADPDEEEDDAPFSLTGQSGRRVVYKARDGEDAESEDAEDTAAQNAGFQHDIEDAFRAGPLPKRPFEPGPRRHEETLTDFDKFYDEQADGGQPDFEFYDENAAASLQAQLESTDLAAYEARRIGGGLAVAAAWAMFFSVISGVALALVTLRSDIMAALPGTSSLYRAIGFDVAESGIDFADVSYRWTVAQGKPMIEVKGQVVNVTDRRLTVPRVLINVRDSQSSDAVKVTASVPTESLAPRESASFTLEFMSPPKNISQIELEFDRNQ